MLRIMAMSESHQDTHPEPSVGAHRPNPTWPLAIPSFLQKLPNPTSFKALVCKECPKSPSGDCNPFLSRGQALPVGSVQFLLCQGHYLNHTESFSKPSRPFCSRKNLEYRALLCFFIASFSPHGTEEILSKLG